MDKLVKLKLEMVYKDLPIEEAKKEFEAITRPPVPVEEDSGDDIPPPKAKKPVVKRKQIKALPPK